MDGQAIFSFALNTVPKAITRLLRGSQTDAGPDRLVGVPPGERFMLENLARSSRVPADKMVYYLETVGNTVSASIPLAIEAYVQSGRIQPGHRLLLAGFGVGLCWATCWITWG